MNTKRLEMIGATAIGVLIAILLYQWMETSRLELHLYFEIPHVLIAGIIGMLSGGCLVNTREVLTEMTRAIQDMPCFQQPIDKEYLKKIFASMQSTCRLTAKALKICFRWMDGWVWIALSNCAGVFIIGFLWSYVFDWHGNSVYDSDMPWWFAQYALGLLSIVCVVAVGILSAIVCFYRFVQLPMSKLNDWFRRYESFSFFGFVNSLEDGFVLYPDALYPVTEFTHLLRNHLFVLLATLYTLLLSAYALVSLACFVCVLLFNIPVMVVNLSLALATTRRLAVMEGVLIGYAFSLWHDTHNPLWILVSMLVGVATTLLSYEVRQLRLKYKVNAEIYFPIYLVKYCINSSQRVCGVSLSKTVCG